MTVNSPATNEEEESEEDSTNTLNYMCDLDILIVKQTYNDKCIQFLVHGQLLKSQAYYVSDKYCELINNGLPLYKLTHRVQNNLLGALEMHSSC